MNTNQHESLLRHQWHGYRSFHRSRRNLLIHIIAVPAFLLASIGLVVSLAAGAWIGAPVAVAVMFASLMVQGRGHRGEPNPPEPFTGPRNAVARLLAEQWITFPRFVLSGQWSEAVRQTSEPHHQPECS